MERLRRRWWVRIVTVVAAVVITGAVISGAFQLAILLVPQFADNISAYVSRVAGRPVQIGGVHLGWRGVSPRLDLSDIVVYDEDGAGPEISAERLRLGFGLIALLRGERVPQHIVLSGVHLSALIDAEGHVSVRGLDTAGGAAPAPNWQRHLDRFQEISLEDCEILLHDARLPDSSWTFVLREASIERTRGGARGDLILNLPPDIGETMTMAAQIEGDLTRRETWSGRWSASVEKLSGLPWLNVRLAHGAEIAFRETQVRLQGTIAAGKPEGTDLLLEAGAVLGRRGNHHAQLRGLELASHIEPVDGGWRAAISRLELQGRDSAWPQAQAQVKWTRAADEVRQLDLSAQYFAVGDLLPWLAMIPGDWLREGETRLQNAEGVVRGFALRWQGAPSGTRYTLHGSLEGFGLAPGVRTPGVHGVSGEISAGESGGKLVVQDGPLVLDYARLFTQPVAFDAVAGEVSWTYQAKGWQIEVPRVSARLLDSEGSGAMKLFVPRGGGPSTHLALTAAFSSKDATRLKPYTPLIWSKNLRVWLERAIAAGAVPKGELKIEGLLADFPFDDKTGVFALDLDIVGAQLAYAPEWPPVEQASGHLAFRGSGLKIVGNGGRISGNRIVRAEARIPDFAAMRLSIDGEVEGRAERFYQFLRSSPLVKPLSGLLTRTEVEGDAQVDLHLDIPLKEVRETTVDGKVRLAGVQLAVPQLQEPVRDIRGELRFDRDGAEADALSGRLFGTPVTAALEHEGKTHRLAVGFDVIADPAGSGLSQFIPANLRPRLEGRSHWRAQLGFTPGQVSEVQLESDLKGLALSLPQPLRKAAAESWPSAVVVRTDDAFPLRIEASVSDQLAVDLAFSRPADTGLVLRRALLRLGPGPKPAALEDGLVAIGTVSDLDLLGWADLARDLPRSESKGPPLSADLNVGHLWLGGQTIDGVRLAVQPDVGGWLVDLAGNGAKGQVRYRAPDAEGEGSAITARLDHLKLNFRDPPEPKPAPVVEEKKKKPPTDPNQLPVLDIAIQKLNVGATELNRIEFATARVTGGQRIARVHTEGGPVELQLSGSWLRNHGRSAAKLDFDLKTSAIADLLRGAGFAPNIAAKDSEFNGNLNWPIAAPGAEAGISWEQAEGTIKIDIDNGTLRAVEPGAGRVLGLINFYALPRRLTLDFRDVVSKGLSFDHIKGEFKLADGSAVTDNLNIDAPSLRLEMRGRVGLAQRDYDQRITVYPDVSSGVTIGAFLLGGPAAGALALLAQEIFEGPLDKVTDFRYRITGSWDDPQAQPISPEGVPLPAKQAPKEPARTPPTQGPRS